MSERTRLRSPEYKAARQGTQPRTLIQFISTLSLLGGLGVLALLQPNEVIDAASIKQPPATYPAELLMDQSISPYDMATQLTHEERMEYVLRHYWQSVGLRRSFEPDGLVYPESVIAWLPYIIRAIAENNQSQGLMPDDPQAPQVVEVLHIVLLETCGKAVVSSAGAQWPGGVVPRWHPTIASNPEDRWINVKEMVRYFAEGLTFATTQGVGSKDAVVRAMGYYNGHHQGFYGQTEDSITYMALTQTWLARGQSFIDDRIRGMCSDPTLPNGWSTWETQLRGT